MRAGTITATNLALDQTYLGAKHRGKRDSYRISQIGSQDRQILSKNDTYLNQIQIFR